MITFFKRLSQKIILFAIWLTIFSSCFLVTLLSQKHPVGLIKADKLQEVRQKILSSPYDKVLELMRTDENLLSNNLTSVYNQETLIRLRSYLYLLTSDEGWGNGCFNAIEELSNDTVFVQNPMSFGLTRAAILRSVSQAYDFCYDGWSENQRIFVANMVFELMQTMNASMGPHSNNRLESNWMGVRYGSVLFASIVLNDELNASLGRKEILNAYTWDVKERLKDHVRASYTSRGWFVESMGYQFYDGSFVWPALIAFQNSLSPEKVDFKSFVPELLEGYRQNVTGTVAINTGRGMGIKADLADDHPMAGFQGWAFWQRLLSEEDLDAVRWMHQYLLKPQAFKNKSTDLFYSILYADSPPKDYNPASEGYLNYCEPEQGVVMFRNQFIDSTDIVATFNTSSKRYGGHAGPDNLTFRITGLGNIWVIGGGRTGDPNGQTNLFPPQEQVLRGKSWAEGHLDHYGFEGRDGSGYAIGSGSCLGVNHHRRLMMADYSGRSGAKAVFIIKDISENGMVWRLHTPGFNRVELTSDGALVIAPNGSSMKITVPGIVNPNIQVRKVRYGGGTQRHNPGIIYNGEAWYDNFLIDIQVEGDVLVLMTMQEADVPHPNVIGDQQSRIIKVGDYRLKIPSLKL